MKTIAFFNNKGGVGKTTLVYHLAHMFPRLGYRTLAVDLDPQANLTSAILDEEALETICLPDHKAVHTVTGAIQPILDGVGDIGRISPVKGPFGLIAGDLGLSRFEDKLSEAWPKCLTGDLAALRATSAFHRIILDAGSDLDADVSLIDVGPNLGAINRAALLAADFLVIPLAADLFSLQGLRNLGPTIRGWRKQWKRVLEGLDPNLQIPLPSGAMVPAGYVVLQHVVRLDRPTKWFEKWMKRIPETYETEVLDSAPGENDGNSHRLATLRNYRSLMPMAQEARKPMFDLRPADGAIGSHTQLVMTCREDFERLAHSIAKSCGLQ